MNILNAALYCLALATKKHENYGTWARTRISKPVELSEGLFYSYCSLPDGRIGRAWVEAPTAHSARTIIADHVAKSRLAFEYGIDMEEREAHWIAFYPADTDLFA